MTTEQYCTKLLKQKKTNKYFYNTTFKRHINDLSKFKDNDNFRFNEKMAKAYIYIIESLTHLKGELAHQKFKLEIWQKALIGILAGWEVKNKDDKWVRRFNTSYIFISRKNGKSILASGFSIADMILRPDIGGEIKICATKKEQAQIVYNDILGQLKNHKDLSNKIHSARGKITYKPLETEITTLGNESTASKEDGFNASIGIVDEYSAHGTRALFDIIESSMGSKIQPIMFIITTAGFDLGSPSVAEYEYSKKILTGVIEDEHYFAFVACPYDIEGKEYKKFSKDALNASNPNIDISVESEFLNKMKNKAIANPEGLVSYLTKHENRFVASSEIYIQMEDWRQNALEEEPCLKNATDKVFGLDLSISDDFTALSIMYKLNEDEYYLKSMFFIPEDNIINRAKELRVPLQTWVDMGHIITTKGNTIDYDYIFDYLEKNLTANEEKEDYNINIEMGYDPFRSKELVRRIENQTGFQEIKAVRQGFLTLSEPTKMLLDFTKTGKLKHDNNPVMNWMISNIAVVSDKAGNLMVQKGERNRKIDGVASAIICLECYIDKVGEEMITEIIWV